MAPSDGSLRMISNISGQTITRIIPMPNQQVRKLSSAVMSFSEEHQSCWFHSYLFMSISFATKYEQFKKLLNHLNSYIHSCHVSIALFDQFLKHLEAAIHPLSSLFILFRILLHPFIFTLIPNFPLDPLLSLFFRSNARKFAD